MLPEKSLRIPDDVAEFIRKAHPQLKRKIRDALNIISDDPDAGKSLKDELKGLKSFRISRFRIIYRLSSHRQIDIIAIGPRKNIYDETLKIVKSLH